MIKRKTSKASSRRRTVSSPPRKSSNRRKSSSRGKTKKESTSATENSAIKDLKQLLSKASKEELVQIVIESLQRVSSPFQVVTPGSENEKVREKLAKAEEKIGKALRKRGDDASTKPVEGELAEGLSTGDDDDDLKSGNFPNLKYKKPKYDNIESILQYIESPDQGTGSGVKLVIMNFND